MCKLHTVTDSLTDTHLFMSQDSRNQCLLPHQPVAGTSILLEVAFQVAAVTQLLVLPCKMTDAVSCQSCRRGLL